MRMVFVLFVRQCSFALKCHGILDASSATDMPLMLLLLLLAPCDARSDYVDRSRIIGYFSVAVSRASNKLPIRGCVRHSLEADT